METNETIILSEEQIVIERDIVNVATTNSAGDDKDLDVNDSNTSNH